MNFKDAAGMTPTGDDARITAETVARVEHESLYRPLALKLHERAQTFREEANALDALAASVQKLDTTGLQGLIRLLNATIFRSK